MSKLYYHGALTIISSSVGNGVMVYFRGFLKNLFKKTLYLLFGNFVGYKVDILENFNQ